MKLGIATLAGLVWLGLAASASAQEDQPPPGCRWQGGPDSETILACKDLQGYWRRSGDSEIVGYDPPRKPKLKPAVAAPPKVAPAPAPVVATPAPPPVELAPAPVAVQAAPAEPPAIPVPPAPASPQPPAPKPWWEGFWASLWQAILNFLKFVGLTH